VGVHQSSIQIGASHREVIILEEVLLQCTAFIGYYNLSVCLCYDVYFTRLFPGKCCNNYPKGLELSMSTMGFQRWIDFLHLRLLSYYTNIYL
jgi:hypothetical protein